MTILRPDTGAPDRQRRGNLRPTVAIPAGANPLLIAVRLGHTSTRMVEKHYVSLFGGPDREGERPESVAPDVKQTSERLSPASVPERI